VTVTISALQLEFFLDMSEADLIAKLAQCIWHWQHSNHPVKAMRTGKIDSKRILLQNINRSDVMRRHIWMPGVLWGTPGGRQWDP